MLLASVSLAVVGCIICGVAPNAIIFLIGRAFQGAGGGAATALAEVITSDLIPAEFRPRWLMIMNVVWALGTASGPVIGALAVDSNLWVYLFIAICGTSLTSLEINFLPQHWPPHNWWWALYDFDNRY